VRRLIDFTKIFAAGLTAVAIGQSALVAAPAQAQTGAQDPASTQVQGVTVTADRVIADKVKNFVAGISKTAPGIQVARWDHSICTGVLGLPEAHARYMNDRIAANAVAAGLDVGKPGCDANVLILVAPNADAFTAQIVHDHPKVFGAFSTSHSRGRGALKDFVHTPRPVRWWHLTQTKATGGFTASESTESGRGLQAPTMRVYSASHIHTNVVEVFGNILIVVDAKGAAGVSYQALCDYISMVALAQINPDVDVTSLPSILTLFHDRDAGRPLPAGLTEWDKAYLKALYDVSANNTASRERQQITDQMREKATAPTPSNSDKVPPKQ
jgi:hypothetical protein